MRIENKRRRDGEEESDPLGLKKLAIVLRDELIVAASQLDKHAQNVHIARITGGTVAVAGGVTTIVGVALIPFTLGLSAVVSAIVAASLAAAGGLTVGGASLAKVFIDKFKKEKFVTKWNDFNEMLTTELQKSSPDTYRRLREELIRRVGEAMAGSVAGDVEPSAGAARRGSMGEAAARVAVTASAGSIVLNAALLGINLHDIIDGSIQLHTQAGPEAGEYLRKLARSLDEFARTGLSQEYLLNNNF